MKISVIGSGSWGSALSILLAGNGHDITLWSYFAKESEMLSQYREHKDFLPGVMFPENVSFTSDLERAVYKSELIIMVTPSGATRKTAENLCPFISEGQIIVNASKGLDLTSLKRLSETIKEVIPKSTVAVISGPSHAEEVSRGLPTTNVVAADDIKVAQYLQDVFMRDTFRVYTANDIKGFEKGGALKNIIALAAGVSDGLGYGDNTKAALMTRGLAEIARLGVSRGANLSTFSGLSGMGDLIVTCTSMHSRNRRAGILIGQGKTAKEAEAEVKMVVEGIGTTKAAYALAEKSGIEMPITTTLHGVLFENKPVCEVTHTLMTRQRKHESDTGFML